MENSKFIDIIKSIKFGEKEHQKRPIRRCIKAVHIIYGIN
jgi:hypothetical protein